MTRRLRRFTFGSVLAGIALVVGVGAAGAEDEPLEPELMEVSVTYQTDVGPSPATRIIAIRTLGAAPTEGARLVSATGERTVVVTVQRASECASKEPRDTGLGTEVWCLKLAGIVPGEPITGTLQGESTSLTLTVEARHDWRNPAMWTAGTLIVALGLAFVTLKVLPSYISNVQLGRTRRDEDLLVGLSEWADEAETNRLSTAAIVSRLRWAKRHGAAKVRAARTELGVLQQNSPLAGAPLLGQVSNEIGRGQLVEADDVLTAEGKPAVSDAEKLRRVLASAHAQHETFIAIADDLIAAVDPADTAAATQAKAMGEQAHAAFLQLATFEAWQERLSAQLNYIHSLRLKTVPGTLTASLTVAPGPTAPPPTTTTTSDKSSDDNTGQFVLATGLTLSVALILAAVAATTVLAGTYIPDTTFGTREDYLVLTTGTLSSSAVTTIVTLLLFLRSPNEWNA